ncbi:MAG: Carboxypeptidase regulatory-like domain [Acidobacteriota bacterium]|jgi:hypothetical protein|nr:Carboxypeptidase regulatory-like domain [Acidobacteriota bacterium]
MRTLTISFALLLFTLPLVAVTIRGNVTIGHESPLPGTTVSIKVRDTIRTTVTDVSGAFAFENVPEGSYIVRAEIAGFKMAKKAKPIRITRNDVRIAIAMKIEPGIVICERGEPIRDDGPSFTMSQRDADKLPIGH